MSEVYIYPHLAVGDQIIISGAVREIAKEKYDKVFLFAKIRTEGTIKFLYRDNPNIEIIIGTDPNWYQDYQLLNKYRDKNLKIIGHDFLDRSNRTGKSFDVLFYELAGIPFRCKWDSFYVERDLNREKELINKVNATGEYIFIHEDKSRNLCIDRSKLPNCRIIEAFPTDNIFDWMGVLEGAQEIHIIESAFSFLIESFEHWTQPLVAHRYARKLDVLNTPVYRRDWKIIC
jgi:hypothetical protein